MKSNSISNNARKLKKYSKRLAKSHDVEKNKVYNQKIRFYQQNMKGGGVEPDANTNVDALISKIDSLIQQSNAIKQSGGSIQKLQGSRIMSNMRNQRGGVGEEEVEEINFEGMKLDELLERANKIGDIPKDVSDTQQKTVDEINAKITDITGAFAQDKEVIDKLKAQIEQLKLRIRQLMAEKEGIEGNKKQNDEEIEKLRAQIEELKKKLDELEQANKKLREEKDALQKENEKSEGINGEKDNQIRNLQDEMNKVREEADNKRKELEEKITKLQNELEKKTNDCNNINKQIEEKNEEIGVYETRLKDATDALRKLLRQNTDLRGLNEKLRENLTKIQTNINKIQPDIHNEPEILISPYKPEVAKEGGNRMRSLDELLTYSVQIPADF